ncbi:MAG: CaiB/BaiF CoA transferase family protein [Solirubrobacteraceae bacterium]
MRGPLDGVRVLDFTRAFGGPFLTMMMGEMDATVVKVERPEAGDETRAWPPIAEGGVSTYFAALNRSKLSLTLDLKQPPAVEVARELADWADVVVENFTPGVADRLGIGAEALRARNPRLIYCSVSGFGQTGPYRERRGYDPILQAMGGLMGLTGERDGGPIKTMLPVADLMTASFAAIPVLAALYDRERTGEGQYLDVAMLDVMTSALSTVGTAYLLTGTVPPRSGTENPWRAPSAAFECADGVHVQLVPNQRQWLRFCELLGVPELADDPRFADPAARVEHQEELYPRLRERLRERPAHEWLEAFEQAGIPAGPIHTLDTLFADPQVREREMVTELEHPGPGTLRVLELPFRMSATPVRIRRRPPRLGEDTSSVLSDVLGYSGERIEELHAAGAV